MRQKIDDNDSVQQRKRGEDIRDTNGVITDLAPVQPDENDPQRTGSRKNDGRADQVKRDEYLCEGRDGGSGRHHSRQSSWVVTSLHASVTTSPTPDQMICPNTR